MNKEIVNSKGEPAVMVTILCLTYNHKSYIRQCLEGFVMQKTNFRFEAIVHDDASTDDTATIVREFAEKYPEIIKPIFEIENQYSKNDGSIGRIMNAHTRGKYVAMCEGDDYWTDPLKLQKQVDFLEANPEYGMVHTNYKVLHHERNIINSNGAGKYKISEGNIFEDLFRGCWIKTLTVCLRRELYNYLPNVPEGTFTGDLYLFYEIALHSKVHFMNFESGIYRVLSESACHTTNEKVLYRRYNSYRMLDYFYAERGDISKKTRYLLDKKWFIWDLKYWLRNGVYEKFVELEDNGYLENEHGLRLIYRICHMKIPFLCISFMLKLKLKILKQLKRY